MHMVEGVDTCVFAYRNDWRIARKVLCMWRKEFVMGVMGIYIAA